MFSDGDLEQTREDGLGPEVAATQFDQFRAGFRLRPRICSRGSSPDTRRGRDTPQP